MAAVAELVLRPLLLAFILSCFVVILLAVLHPHPPSGDYVSNI
jgi:hypothetical protein